MIDAQPTTVPGVIPVGGRLFRAGTPETPGTSGENARNQRHQPHQRRSATSHHRR